MRPPNAPPPTLQLRSFTVTLSNPFGELRTVEETVEIVEALSWSTNDKGELTFHPGKHTFAKDAWLQVRETR